MLLWRPRREIFPYTEKKGAEIKLHKLFFFAVWRPYEQHSINVESVIYIYFCYFKRERQQLCIYVWHHSKIIIGPLECFLVIAEYIILFSPVSEPE